MPTPAPTPAPTPPPPSTDDPATLMPYQQNDVQATREAVRSAKREVVDALTDVDGAFEAHMSALFDRGGRLRADEAMNADAASASLPPNLAVLAAAAAGNATARAARLRIFRSNLRKIRAQNARSGDDLAFGITPFSHLTPDEFRAMYLTPEMAGMAARAASKDDNNGNNNDRNGRRLQQYGGGDPNALQCNRMVTFPSSSSSATPPAAFDWRDVNGVSYVTRVRNQGSCGSCAAFAVTAAYESVVVRKFGDRGYTADRTDLSEQRMLSCWPGDQCRGALPHWYADLQVCKGVSFESDWKYAGVDRDACPAATPTRFGSGATGWAWAPTTPQGYSRAIQLSPVPFGLAASGSAFMNYKAGVFDCSHAATSPVDHAVTLIGWNDAVQMSNGARWGVFVGKNSWGTSWGENGFFRIRKDCAPTGAGGARGPLAMYSPGYALAILS